MANKNYDAGKGLPEAHYYVDGEFIDIAKAADYAEKILGLDGPAIFGKNCVLVCHKERQNNDAWAEALNIKAKELYPGDGKSEIIDRAKYVAPKVIDNAIFWTTGITKCHCWKNYAGEELRNVWVTLEDYQKDAIQKSLEEVARNEEWD